MTAIRAVDLLNEFNSVLRLNFACPADLRLEAENALAFGNKNGLRSKSRRRKELIYLINSRLNLNRKRIRVLIDSAAKHGCYFNYWERKELQDMFDKNCHATFRKWCSKKKTKAPLNDFFQPVNETESLSGLSDFLSSCDVKRRDARESSIEERRQLVQRALFGCFVFQAFETEIIHKYLNRDAQQAYHTRYFDHLLAFHTDQLNRDCGLIYWDVDLSTRSSESYDALADFILSGIKSCYTRLSNHCFLAIRLRGTGHESEWKWKLFSDIVLFAEKHREIRLEKGYFRPQKIRRVTAEYIPEIKESECRFELVNEGFYFRDCYVVSSARQEGTNRESYDLILLFEKNERDEQILPCPECRSTAVAGNSYPTLGVRSWECRNAICPARSKYDRGHRYSLSSIIRREAIQSQHDEIPRAVRQRWRKDVVFGVNEDEILEMLVRHFSLTNDQVLVLDKSTLPKRFLGRDLNSEATGRWRSEPGIRKSFLESAFFRRFAIRRKDKHCQRPDRVKNGPHGIEIMQGDCEAVLNDLDPEIFDGAVTSPPYYNARRYSQWPNIYCYLYDIYNAAIAVYRVLKPGSPYIFNVFDYFDNENIVAFSAMGKKRMILGAYVIHLFTKCGFEIVDNTIWFKGEIEGKRNFNQGNTSPYYQLPHNCWEHCLVFRKPGGKDHLPEQVQILKQQPVVKMVRGRNTHGHSAPFPREIPRLLMRQLPTGSRVLDPYGGSMTTAIAALEHGLSASLVEKNAKYFELGWSNILRELGKQGELFLGNANGDQLF